MNYSKLLIILALVLIGGLASVHAAPNALLPKGKKIKISLFDKNQTLTTILIPDKPTKQEKTAASLLQRGLKGISGENLKIIKEKDFSGKGNYFAIGTLTKFKPVETSSFKFGGEGYSIVMENNNIFLRGGYRRGPINAVMALLEEDWGSRWYSRYSAPVFKKLGTELTITPREYAPRLQIRDPFYYESRDLKWAAWNRMSPINTILPPNYGTTHSYVPYLFVHTLPRIISYYRRHEKIHEKYPEMLAMVKGKRTLDARYTPCLSSEKLVDLITRDVLSAATARPNYEIISISQTDGKGMFCQCPKCRAMIKKEKFSGLLISFVNKVAARVKKRFPRLKISTLAYGETGAIPKTIRPADNVVIQLCDDKLLKAWSKIAPEIYIWENWPICYKHFLMLVPRLPQVAKKIITCSSYPQMKGMMFLGTYLSPGGSLAPLYCWVMTKLMWNSKLNTKKLIADFCDGYYGKAGKTMQKYCNMVFYSGLRMGKGAVWNFKTHRCSSWFKISPWFIKKARALFAKAKKEAASDPKIINEIEREEVGVIYMRLLQGPNGINDIKAYRQDIERLRKLVKQLKITKFHELKREMTIPRQFKLWEDRVAKYK